MNIGIAKILILYNAFPLQVLFKKLHQTYSFRFARYPDISCFSDIATWRI